LGTESFVRIGCEGDELLIPDVKCITTSSYLFYRGQQTETNYLPMFLSKSGDQCIVNVFGGRGSPHGSWKWSNDSSVLELEFHSECQEDKARCHTFQQIPNTCCFSGNTKNTIGTILVPASSMAIQHSECDSLYISHFETEETFSRNFYVYKGRDKKWTYPMTLLKLFLDGTAKSNNNLLNPQFWKCVNGFVTFRFCCGETHIFERLFGTENFVRSCSDQTYFLFATLESF
jgi:hypothetical protein